MTCRCPRCSRRLVVYDGERTGRKQGARRRCKTCKQTVLWLLNENGSFSPPFELPDEVGGWFHHCCCAPARSRARPRIRGRYLYQGELDPESPAAAAPVRCRRCGLRVRARALEEHRRTCRARQEEPPEPEPDATADPGADREVVHCGLCAAPFPPDTIETHLAACRRRAVPCPDCDAEVRRDRLHRHRTRRCPGRDGAAGG